MPNYFWLAKRFLGGLLALSWMDIKFYHMFFDNNHGADAGYFSSQSPNVLSCPNAIFQG